MIYNHDDTISYRHLLGEAYFWFDAVMLSLPYQLNVLREQPTPLDFEDEYSSPDYLYI